MQERISKFDDFFVKEDRSKINYDVELNRKNTNDTNEKYFYRKRFFKNEIQIFDPDNFLSKYDFLFYDLETLGFSDKILEFGCVYINKGYLRFFYNSLVKAKRNAEFNEVSPNLARIMKFEEAQGTFKNNLNVDFCFKNGNDFKNIFDFLNKNISEETIYSGYNIFQFDNPILFAVLKEEFISKVNHHKSLDLLKIVRKKLTLNSFSLEKVYEALNFEHIKFHCALNDCFATLKILISISQSLSFEEFNSYICKFSENGPLKYSLLLNRKQIVEEIKKIKIYKVEFIGKFLSKDDDFYTTLLKSFIKENRNGYLLLNINNPYFFRKFNEMIPDNYALREFNILDSKYDKYYKTKYSVYFIGKVLRLNIFSGYDHSRKDCFLLIDFDNSCEIFSENCFLIKSISISSKETLELCKKKMHFDNYVKKAKIRDEIWSISLENKIKTKKKYYEYLLSLEYDSLCIYLQKKYGVPKKNYFSKSWEKNKLNYGKFKGLFVHHIKENIADNLSTVSSAKTYSYEYQHKEYLVYCNYLEHLILHFAILKENPSKYVGLFFFLIPELNYFYFKKISRFLLLQKMDYKEICFDIVKQDKKIYLYILEQINNFVKTNGKVYEISKTKYGNLLEELMGIL